MIKTKIIETTEKYDKDGKLVEKITREETTEDDETKQINTIMPLSSKWTCGILEQSYKKETNGIKITC